MALIDDIKNDLESGTVNMIHEYRDIIFAEAVRLLGDQHEAEDLTFRVFEVILAKIDKYDAKKGGFLSWAKGIMRNEASLMRRGKVSQATILVDPSELREGIQDVDDTTEREILLHSDSELLHKAFKTLPKEMQDAMFLHYVSDLSIVEVAKLLKVQPGTVKMRLHRARKVLLHRLETMMKEKKPLAVLAAVLLGAGALFGAWQAGEAIIESMSESGRAVSMKPPTIEDNQPTLTATDPTAPVMTYPTFSSESTASTEPVSTKQEESTMTTIKKTLLAAVSAVSLASTANAVNVDAIKARVVPEGITAQNMADNNGFTYEYKKDGVKYGVAAFVADGTLNLSEIKALGVTSIDYLIVAGGGSGGHNGGGGGGGAGGMLTSEGVSVADVTALAITVGAGGEGVPGKNNSVAGNDGKPSSITFGDGEPIVAYGGGGGGAINFRSTDDAVAARAGGSGGGGNGTDDKYTSHLMCVGGKGTEGQGNDGGGRGSSGTNKAASGGGGAGGGGDTADSSSATEGGGGAGRACEITGRTVYYAGGGGGGNYSQGAGAFGGGEKNGSEYTAGDDSICGGRGAGKSTDATSGLDGLGGGGGGSGSPSYKASGAGGSGIVVIRWVIPAVRSQVTVVTSGSGSGSVSGAGEYAEGETVELVATAGEDSRFVEWSWDASLPDANADGEKLTFTMIAEPVEITAKFDKKLAAGVTVAFEGGSYGEPDPAYGNHAENADGNEHTYTMGETVIGEGSEKIYLAGWKLLAGTGELVRDSDTDLHDGESISLVKFTCGTSEAFTLVWRWETRYTLTAVANPVEGGTVTGAGDYAAGAMVTLTANVTGGYKLTGWEGAPEDATEDGLTLTFTMPAVPTTVTANFEMVPWGITVVSGTTTNDFRDMCVPGTPYKFLSPRYAEIKEGDSRKRCLGYTLTPMCEGGEEGELIEAVPEGENLAATVTYAEPVRLTWKWADDYYFTLAQDGEGEVAGLAEGWYERETEFTLTATPASGYDFLCWMGSVSGTDTTISGTITKPTNVKALFSPVQQIKSDWEEIEGKPAKMRTVKSLGKTYCVVKFTDSTTYDIPKKVTSIDCLVVGGGGGGGGHRGGGGGAGGFLYQTGLAVTPGETLMVTVGAGGEGGDKDNVGKVGKDTTLEITGQTITVQGGGYGGREGSKPGDGASGGGAGANNYAAYSEIKGGTSKAEAPEQGNPGGGRYISGTKCGAGGGGAGGKGGDVADGKGGDGLPSAITGGTVWYAAGGPGGFSSYATDKYADADANTGDGGTGGAGSGAGYAGGSGVVIIRYALPSKGMVMLIY